MGLDRLFPIRREHPDGTEHRRQLADGLEEVARYADDHETRLASVEGDAVLQSGRAGGQHIEGGLVINEDGADVDFRVEGDTEPNLVFVDASTNRVGIGTNAPTSLVDILSDGIATKVRSANAAIVGLEISNTVAAWHARADTAGGFQVRNNAFAGSAFSIAALAPAATLSLEASGVALGGAGSWGGAVKAVFIADATTSPTSNPAGGVVPYSRTGQLYYRGASGIVSPVHSRRVTTQVDSTSTTLGGVTALDIPMEAGLTYSFELHLHVSPSAAGGHKYDFAAAGGLALSSIIYSLLSHSSAALVLSAPSTTATGSASGESASGATSVFTRIAGTAVCTTSGSLRPRFAQNAASGTSSVLVGSWSRFQRI